MLPDGFEWIPRWQYGDDELTLAVDDWHAASLMRKVTGEWYALLHLTAVPLGPYRMRACASRESGIAGIEAWARRHEAGLREQAAVHRASLPLRRWTAEMPAAAARSRQSEGQVAIVGVDHARQALEPGSPAVQIGDNP